MKKKTILCIFIVTCIFFTVACSSPVNSKNKNDNTENSYEIVSELVSSDNTNDELVEEDVEENFELHPIQWEEPAVSSEEITYEEACAYLDTLMQKYETAYWTIFVEANYYNLSSETIAKLEKKYDNKKYNFVRAPYDYMNYNNTRITSGYFEKYTSVWSNIVRYIDADICVDSPNYLSSDEIEAYIVPDTYIVFGDDKYNFFWEEEHNAETFEEYMAIYPSLSEYIIDDNLKKQADIIDEYAKKYTMLQIEMIKIVCDIMEKCPALELPEELKTQGIFEDMSVYSIYFYYKTIKYIENNPDTYTKLISEEEMVIVNEYTNLFANFEEKNKELFKNLDDKSAEVMIIYGSMCAYINDLEAVQYPSGFVFSFNSSQNKGTNLAVLQLMTIQLYGEMSNYLCELESSYQSEISFHDYLGFMDAFLLDNDVIDKWDLDWYVTYDAFVESYYQIVPVNFIWDNKDGYPTRLEYREGFLTEWESNTAREYFKNEVETWTKREAWNVNEMKFESRSFKYIVEKYGFEQEWIDKTFD